MASRVTRSWEQLILSSRTLTTAVVLAGLLLAQTSAAALPELLYVTEGNRLRRYDLDTLERGPLLEEIVVLDEVDRMLDQLRAALPRPAGGS